jgi:hypothetical protein
VHFRIGAWEGFYLDSEGRERECLVYRIGPDEEHVIDTLTGEELNPPPAYFKLQETE